MSALFLVLTLFSRDALAKTLEFDCEAESYPEIQKVLHHKFAAVYEDAATISQAGGFCISQPDLNTDGVQDIILRYDFGSLYCGTAGCLHEVYLRDKADSWYSVLQAYTYDRGITLGEMQNGYRILVIEQKIECPCEMTVNSTGITIIKNVEEKTYVFNPKTESYQAQVD